MELAEQPNTYYSKLIYPSNIEHLTLIKNKSLKD